MLVISKKKLFFRSIASFLIITLISLPIVKNITNNLLASAESCPSAEASNCSTWKKGTNSGKSYYLYNGTLGSIWVDENILDNADYFVGDYAGGKYVVIKPEYLNTLEAKDQYYEITITLSDYPEELYKYYLKIEPADDTEFTEIINQTIEGNTAGTIQHTLNWTPIPGSDIEFRNTMGGETSTLHIVAGQAYSITSKFDITTTYDGNKTITVNSLGNDPEPFTAIDVTYLTNDKTEPTPDPDYTWTKGSTTGLTINNAYDQSTETPEGIKLNNTIVNWHNCITDSNGNITIATSCLNHFEAGIYTINLDYTAEEAEGHIFSRELGTLAIENENPTPTYTVTLNPNGASNVPTASTQVTYGMHSLDPIAILPIKATTTETRTISGFTLSESANGATVSSTETLNSKSDTHYVFNGWYEEPAAINKVASNDPSPTYPKLEPNTAYTNEERQWIDTSGNVTLYAGYTSTTDTYTSVTLPTITKDNFTCGWSTNSSSTNYTYASNASITPNSNLTLYGICKANSVNPDDPVNPDGPVNPDDPNKSDEESNNKNYPITNSIQTLGENDNLIIKSNGKADKLIGIEIDGKEIPKDYFKITTDPKTGEIIIEINHDFAINLKDGEHKIAIVYDDGTSEGIITKNGNNFVIENIDIEVPNTSNITPDTGTMTKKNGSVIDNAPIILTAIIVVSSIATMAIRKNGKKITLPKNK